MGAICKTLEPPSGYACNGEVNMKPEKEAVFTASEIGRKLGVSHEAVRGMIQRGHFSLERKAKFANYKISQEQYETFLVEV